MHSWKISTFLILALTAATVLQAQPRDPGIRAGAPGAGQPLERLTAGELDYFTHHGLPSSIKQKTLPMASARASIWILAAVATLFLG